MEEKLKSSVIKKGTENVNSNLLPLEKFSTESKDGILPLPETPNIETPSPTVKPIVEIILDNKSDVKRGNGKKTKEFKKAKEFKDVKKEKKRKEASSTAYYFGHFIKNLLAEPLSIVERIGIELEGISESSDLSKIIRQRDACIKKTKKYKEIHDHLYTVVEITDAASKALNSENDSENVISSKEFRFNQTEPVDLILLIKARLKNYSIENGITECRIRPFLDNETLLPKVSFYDTCIIEIIENFKKSDAPTLFISKYCDNNKKGICFSNELTRDKYFDIEPIYTNALTENSKKQPEFVKVDSKFGFRGAIGYLSNLYAILDIGCIKFRIIEKDNKKYFELVLILEGLNYE